MIAIFDLDGTVWDSMPGILGSLEYTFVAHNRMVPSRERLRSNIGPPLQLMLRELGFPEEEIDSATEAYRDRYSEWGAYEVELFPGVVDALEQLAARDVRLATATSKGVVAAEQMLEHLGICDRFEVIGAATMDTTAITKDAVLARTLDALGRPDPAHCLMFGDRRYDVEGAAAHGIDTVGVLWGYGSAEELSAAGAWRLADAPEDIPALVARHEAP